MKLDTCVIVSPVLTFLTTLQDYEFVEDAVRNNHNAALLHNVRGPFVLFIGQGDWWGAVDGVIRSHKNHSASSCSVACNNSHIGMSSSAPEIVGRPILAYLIGVYTPFHVPVVHHFLFLPSLLCEMISLAISSAYKTPAKHPGHARLYLDP